jgi:tetratricopeptide (TPR) repeat protein
MASESFLESRKIRLDVPEATDRQISNACYNIAGIYVKLCNFKEALHFYRESLSLERKIELEHHNQHQSISSVSRPHGSNHQSTVPLAHRLSTIIQIASICLQIDDFEDALQYYLDAMKLCFAYDDHTFVQQDIGIIQMGIDACYKGRISNYVNESCKTNGIFNCASAA